MTIKTRTLAIGLALAAVGSLSACNPQKALDTVIGQNPAFNGQPCLDCDGPDTVIQALDPDTGQCYSIGAKYAAANAIVLVPCPTGR